MIKAISLKGQKYILKSGIWILSQAKSSHLSDFIQTIRIFIYIKKLQKLECLKLKNMKKTLARPKRLCSAWCMFSGSQFIKYSKEASPRYSNLRLTSLAMIKLNSLHKANLLVKLSGFQWDIKVDLVQRLNHYCKFQKHHKRKRPVSLPSCQKPILTLLVTTKLIATAF